MWICTQDNNPPPKKTGKSVLYYCKDFLLKILQQTEGLYFFHYITLSILNIDQFRLIFFIFENNRNVPKRNKDEIILLYRK